jgi:hypothetical protein
LLSIGYRFRVCWLYLYFRFVHILLILHNLSDFELYLNLVIVVFYVLLNYSWDSFFVSWKESAGCGSLYVCFIFCGWFTSGMVWFQSFPHVHRVSLRLLQEDPQRWGIPFFVVPPLGFPPILYGPQGHFSCYFWSEHDFLTTARLVQDRKWKHKKKEMGNWAPCRLCLRLSLLLVSSCFRLLLSVLRWLSYKFCPKILALICKQIGFYHSRTRTLLLHFNF